MNKLHSCLLITHLSSAFRCQIHRAVAAFIVRVEDSTGGIITTAAPPPPSSPPRGEETANANNVMEERELLFAISTPLCAISWINLFLNARVVCLFIRSARLYSSPSMHLTVLPLPRFICGISGCLHCSIGRKVISICLRLPFLRFRRESCGDATRMLGKAGSCGHGDDRCGTAAITFIGVAFRSTVTVVGVERADVGVADICQNILQ